MLADWQRQRGLVTFPDVTACGTNTEVSLPWIFSPLTREQDGDRKPRHGNLLDVLQRAGVSTDCLRGRASEPVSHDHVFHSVLGLRDIRTSIRQPALDLYTSCQSG